MNIENETVLNQIFEKLIELTRNGCLGWGNRALHEKYRWAIEMDQPYTWIGIHAREPMVTFSDNWAREVEAPCPPETYQTLVTLVQERFLNSVLYALTKIPPKEKDVQ